MLCQSRPNPAISLVGQRYGRYLKAAGYFRFKARRKPYLLKKHKAARLKWAKERKGWTLEDWSRVIWTDEATFETGLDSRLCYPQGYGYGVSILEAHI